MKTLRKLISKILEVIVKSGAKRFFKAATKKTKKKTIVLF